MGVLLPVRERGALGCGTDASRLRPGWRSLVLFAALALGLWSVAGVELVHRASSVTPLDFQVYRDAALNMLHGGATYHRHFTFAHLFFTYPPFALMLMSTLTGGSVMFTLSWWWLVNALALTAFIALAIRTVSQKTWPMVLAQSLALSGAAFLFLQPIRSNFYFGQINILLMLAVLVDLTRVRSHLRGTLTGLASAVKLTPLIYIALFFVAHDRRSSIRAIGAFVGATALAWVLLPADSLTYWFHQAFSPGHKGGAVGPMNQSWFGFIGHFASSLGPATLILWLLVDVATALVGILLARRYLSTGRTLDALLALALTEVLVSPISWTHHWSWVILVPILMFFRPSRSWSLNIAMSLLMVVAVVAPYRWDLRHGDHHGLLVSTLNFSLLFAGAALLITMALTQWSESRQKVTPRHPSSGIDERVLEPIGSGA